MTKNKITFFEVMVYVAYSYFIFLGLSWFIMSYIWGGYISAEGIIVVALFGIQAWWKNKLTNLILGILTLGASIFILLEFLAKSAKSGFNSFTGTMAGLALLGIILSGVLIFSYTKLSFKDL